MNADDLAGRAIEAAKELALLHEWAICIRLLPILDVEDDDEVPRLTPATSEHRAEIAAQYFRYFGRETEYGTGGNTIEVNNHEQTTYLIRALNPITKVPLAMGAVSIASIPGREVLTWLWVFPGCRGGHTNRSGQWWQDLEAVHPGFAIDRPNGAMTAFLAKVDPDETHDIVRLR